MLASTTRVFLGVLIGLTLAIPAGFALGWFWRLRAAFDPLLSFFRALPPIALIPLIIVYLGIGEEARVFILAWSSFFVSTIVIFEGTIAIDPIYVKAAQILGARQSEVLARVVLPLTIPTILVALRVAIGTGWGTLVASELIAAQTGLGATVSMAASLFQIPTIYAAIVTIGLLALAMDRITRAITVRLVSWQERVER